MKKLLLIISILSTVGLVNAQTDPLEYATGNLTAQQQLFSYPLPRFQPGHTMNRNFNWFDIAYFSRWGQTGVLRPQMVIDAKTNNMEFYKNWNYYYVISPNITSYGNPYDYIDTIQSLPGAFVNVAKRDPSIKTSAICLMNQIPGNVNSANLAPSNYIRNSSGQYLDLSGNVITSGKYFSPAAPGALLQQDGAYLKNYLSNLVNALGRPLDVLNDNGESLRLISLNGGVVNNDPTVLADYNALGFPATKTATSINNYRGQKYTQFMQLYRNEFMSASPQTAYTYYGLDGQSDYRPVWSKSKFIQSKINGRYYPTGDLYVRWPNNWKAWAGAWHGLGWFADCKYFELQQGDSLMSPFCTAGWNADETQNVRPAQYLSLLKILSAWGSEFFYPAYFSLSTPFQDSKNWGWQTVMPVYAQAVTSRWENYLKQGVLLEGDVPRYFLTNTTLQPDNPKYLFYTGDSRQLVAVRKLNGANKYVITAAQMVDANTVGNAPMVSYGKFKLGNDSIKLEFRRQGSVYIYDASNTSAKVFYQLDRWHQYEHPERWSKDFVLEAEVFDNTPNGFSVKTEVPAGTAANDYSNFTSFLSFTNLNGVEYNINPRGTSGVNHYVWVRARSANGGTSGFSVKLDNGQTNIVPCVKGNTWTWYRYDGSTGQQITYNSLTPGNHKITVTPTNATLEIDQIIITQNSGNIQSPFATPCSASASATITPSGATTFCTGGSVTLTANSGTSYAWSNGATTQSITVSTSGNYTVTVNSGAGSATSPITTVTVAAVTPSIITASGSTSLCSGGSVSLSANTGTAYVWSTGSTAQTISVNTSGNYKVIVTQSNGCTSASAITNVTVNSAPTPTISANGSTTLCSGGSVVLTASSGTAYLWSNGATTNAITASTAGNYTVRVTQSSGCFATSAVTAVTIGSAPTPTISASGPTTLCTGGNVTLTASTGTAYLWSNGATTNSITTSSAGNYTVRVTQSGGCSATSAITTVSIGAATTPTISASGPTTFCSGGNVTLTASTGTAYLWSNGATTNAITVSSAGSYTVRVTQSGGCSATSAITTVSIGSATTPTISANGPTTFCTGGNVTLTASTGTAYLWSNGATTNAITVSSAGSYTVRVTQSGGCSATSGATTITIGSAPTPTISANGPTSFCSGGSVTLTASSGAAYLWSNGATTNSINVTAAGNYTVRVSQTGGCSATSAATAVTIGTGNAPTPTINAGGSLTFCQGGSVTLNASSGTAYLWSNGATTQSISATTGGNYTVRVTQSGGCFATSSATTVTVRPSPTFTVTPNGPLNFCQGGNVTFNVTNSNATFYIWYKNNNLAYWGTRNYYTASSAGVYKLRAYLGLCSTYSNSFNVTVPCREGEVLAGEPMFIAYPNPFSNNTTFAFELAQASEVSIRLFDATRKIN
jgi:hypothetical protein